MELKKLVKEYFKFFSEKNEKELFEMFDNKITLLDWENYASGKKKVCEVNKNIFKQLKNIQVKPLKIYKERNTIIAEIIIKVNRKDLLKVVDIISFNEKKKIISIKAYKM